MPIRPQAYGMCYALPHAECTSWHHLLRFHAGGSAHKPAQQMQPAASGSVSSVVRFVQQFRVGVFKPMSASSV
jgi:hypothetical protein